MADSVYAKAFTHAQNNVNDEFYTRLGSIENFFDGFVLKNNPKIFYGKSIILPCDPQESKFVKYFADNYDKLFWKKLISVTYSGGSCGSRLFGTAQSGKIYEYEDGKLTNTYDLDGSGDFRSSEIQRYISDSDFVITNPPYSLFGNFVDICISANVYFFVVGTHGKVSNNNIFTHFKDGQIFGYTFEGDFDTPNGDVKSINVSCWWTNYKLPQRKLPQNLDVDVSTLPLLDNTDIRNVDRIQNIPVNYNGKLAVPVTVNLYDLSDYDILELIKDGYINGKLIFMRVVIRRKR